MKSQFRTNAGALAIRQRRRATSFVSLQRGAMKKSTDDLKAEAVKLSSKRYASTKELRKMGHPYAKRHFTGKFQKGRLGMPSPPFYINRQSGDFVSKWKSLVRLSPNKTITGTVYNLSDHAKWMMGTVKMIKRPILNVAMKRINKRMVSRFAGAMHKANRTI